MSSLSKPSQAVDVFVNCPFDSEYKPLFWALVFAIQACGFRVRCALESKDSGETRIEKIRRLVLECRLSIHDISRTELDAVNSLPRFNMPFELGLCLGASWAGPPKRRKRLLVLDFERYRYQKFLSDIAGQDIKSHDNQPQKLIGIVRDWLNQEQPTLPSKSMPQRSYQDFTEVLPMLAADMLGHPDRLSLEEVDELDYGDRLKAIDVWLIEASDS